MRSLAGERRCDALTALRLRCRSRRLSSAEEGYGELLFALEDADDAAEAEGALGESLGTGDDRADDESAGRAAGLGLGLGGAGRSMVTFSMRILGGSTLNLLPFPLRRGMMAASNRRASKISSLRKKQRDGEIRVWWRDGSDQAGSAQGCLRFFSRGVPLCLAGCRGKKTALGGGRWRARDDAKRVTVAAKKEPGLILRDRVATGR